MALMDTLDQLTQLLVTLSGEIEAMQVDLSTLNSKVDELSTLVQQAAAQLQSQAEVQAGIDAVTAKVDDQIATLGPKVQQP
jgi:phage shock protein A